MNPTQFLDDRSVKVYLYTGTYLRVLTLHFFFGHVSLEHLCQGLTVLQASEGPRAEKVWCPRAGSNRVTCSSTETGGEMWWSDETFQKDKVWSKHGASSAATAVEGSVLHEGCPRTKFIFEEP